MDLRELRPRRPLQPILRRLRAHRCEVGTSPAQLRALAEWLLERHVEEVVMESTAHYWRPIWEALARYWRRRAGRAKAPAPWLGRYTSRMRSRIGASSDGSRIFPMPNAW